MKASSLWVALGLGVVVAALPARAAADEDGPTLSAPRAQSALQRPIVWVEAPNEPTSRTSTGGMIAGIGLIIAGAVQVPVGTAIFASNQQTICPEFDRGVGGLGGGVGGCFDANAGLHRAGAILIATGAASLVGGVALTIWGASRKSSPNADVRVGLGGVSASYRF